MKPHNLSLAAIGLAMLLNACDNDDELALRPAVAEFSTETFAFSENDGVKEIVITLSKSTSTAGTLAVGVTSDVLDQFNISPAPQGGRIELSVAQGTSQVSLQITPVNNEALDGLKKLTFTLLEASRGLQLGVKSNLQARCADDESRSQVAFTLQKTSLLESVSTGSVVTLSLSHGVPGDGDLTLFFANSAAVYGKDFVTEPAATDGRTLKLAVPNGATEVSFIVQALNDALFNDNRDIQFEIQSVSPVLEKGALDVHTLTIKDDELAGRSKSYSTRAGNGWASKREVHYSLNGQIERVTWQNATPGQLAGEYVYAYDDAGLIESVQLSPVTILRYVRENGRIVKSEEYDNGELDAYTVYGYDQAGNIGEMNKYDRIKDGSFAFSLQFVFLYYTDGNLYKKMVYSPVASGDPVWISTQTYEDYIDRVNPFPIEIIHGQPVQNKLPLTFREERTEGDSYKYSFSYDYYPDGRPASRTATGHGISETTDYEYF